MLRSQNSAHTVTVLAVVVVHVLVVRIEVQVVGVVAAIRHTGPVVAVAARVVHLAVVVVEIAGRRKEATLIPETLESAVV